MSYDNLGASYFSIFHTDLLCEICVQPPLYLGTHPKVLPRRLYESGVLGRNRKTSIVTNYIVQFNL